MSPAALQRTVLSIGPTSFSSRRPSLSSSPVTALCHRVNHLRERMYHVSPGTICFFIASSTYCSFCAGVRPEAEGGRATPWSSPCSAMYASMSSRFVALVWFVREEGAASFAWADWGSWETERFGEEVEASDSIDNERCLLRLLVGSGVVNEGVVDGEGGVSIALVSWKEQNTSMRSENPPLLPPIPYKRPVAARPRQPLSGASAQQALRVVHLSFFQHLRDLARMR